MNGRRRRTTADVFCRLDGRSAVFLVGEVRKRNIALTPACISNYRTGIRQPTDEGLDVIQEILSPQSTARRVAEKIAECKRQQTHRS